MAGKRTYNRALDNLYPPKIQRNLKGSVGRARRGQMMGSYSVASQRIATAINEAELAPRYAKMQETRDKQRGILQWVIGQLDDGAELQHIQSKAERLLSSRDVSTKRALAKFDRNAGKLGKWSSDAAKAEWMALDVKRDDAEMAVEVIGRFADEVAAIEGGTSKRENRRRAMRSGRKR